MLKEILVPSQNSRQYQLAALLGVVVFIACLFGNLTRPVGFLPLFWPANALLLVMMLRYPGLHNLSGWGIAFGAYVSAYLLTGNGLFITLWLTSSDLMAALTGVFLFERLSSEDRRLDRPRSVLYLFFICLATGIAAGLTGGGIATVLFDRSWGDGFFLWFSTELVNSMLILPVLLAAPSKQEIRRAFLKFLIFLRSLPEKIVGEARFCLSALLRGQHELFLEKLIQIVTPVAPLLALLGTVVISLLVKGVAAIMFPIPALLWCALSYSLFTTSVLTFLLCLWKIIAVSNQILVIHQVSTIYFTETMSIRLGISLLALGPLIIASFNASQKKLLESLNHAVKHDYLTDALARGAFMNQALEILDQCTKRQTPLAVLMLDIDHFKKVNDQYGHLVGDHALVAFTKTILRSLRKTDCIGRLGGEEFCIVMPHVTSTQAHSIAERLRAEIEQTPISLPSGKKINITVSIGGTYPAGQVSALDTLLAVADKALYQAKSRGRNRVEFIPCQVSDHELERLELNEETNLAPDSADLLHARSSH